MPITKKKSMSYNIKLMLILFYSFLFYSCATENNSTIPQELTERTFNLDMERTAFDGESGETQISAFLFYNDVFYKSYHDLSMDQDGQVKLPTVEGSKIYFIANSPFTLNNLEEGETTLEALLLQATPALPEDQRTNPYLFFSGLYSVSNIDTQLVNLKRSIARIDLDTSRDSLTKITRIVFENIPSQTRYFEHTSPITGEKYSYEKNFAPAFSGIYENLLQLYECGPVKITAYGTYNNFPIKINMELPEVKRNKIYVAKILNAGGTVTGSFEVLPWETGETVEGYPNVTDKISISQSLSDIPQSIEVNYNDNKINIPQSGGEMTLAFLADSQIEVANTDGVISDVTLIPLPPEETPEGVASRIKVQIAPQGKGRLSYAFTLNVKSVLQTHIYDQVNIQVAASEHQIEEVQMGGTTWMAFNARSRDLEDQIYPLDGGTVEETYDKNWLSTIGGLFQWGRIYRHDPWKSYGNNTGKQEQDIPWVKDTHVPCPDGYRLPTETELRALFPLGQVFPGTYDYNGETVTATLHTATIGFTTPTGVKGTPRYLKITSQQTGRQLFFPLSGEKGDKSSSNNPNFGQGFTLWTSDPVRPNLNGGFAFRIKFWPGNNTEFTMPTSKQQLEAEAYAYVRCLKK